MNPAVRGMLFGFVAGSALWAVLIFAVAKVTGL